MSFQSFLSGNGEFTGVGATVGVTIGVGSGVTVGVAFGVDSGVIVGVAFGVDSGVTVGVAFGVDSGVTVGVAFGVDSGVTVGVAVAVGFGVVVGTTFLSTVRVLFKVPLNVPEISTLILYCPVFSGVNSVQVRSSFLNNFDFTSLLFGSYTFTVTT